MPGGGPAGAQSCRRYARPSQAPRAREPSAEGSPTTTSAPAHAAAPGTSGVHGRGPKLPSTSSSVSPSRRVKAYTPLVVGQQHGEVAGATAGSVVPQRRSAGGSGAAPSRGRPAAAAALISVWFGLTAIHGVPVVKPGVGRRRPTASACGRCPGSSARSAASTASGSGPGGDRLAVVVERLDVAEVRRSRGTARWSCRAPRPGRRTACRGAGAAPWRASSPTATRCSPSSPKRETTRGWSWLSQ